MKILSVRFRNIHSLKGNFEIDFEKAPLSETGIFAIVGPTGSGKSTILDVIMLALYGQMPRFNEKISRSSVEKFGTVLTRGTDEAFAEVEYRTKGKTYRSNWSISSARTGNLRDYNMELAEVPSGKLIEDYKSNVPARNEEIIGLNYEQFLKSIILAQGDFSKFLKSKPEERTQMLEKITGTEIYRIIGAKAFEIAKKYKEELAIKSVQLDNFEILSDEQIEELKLSKNKFLDNISKSKKTQIVLNQIYTLKKQIFENQERLLKLNEEKSINQKALVEFKIDEQKIALHENLINLKADLFEVKNLNENIQSTKDKIVREELLIVDIEKNIERFQTNIKEQEKELEISNTNQQKTAPFLIQAKEIDRKLEFTKQKLEQKQLDFSKIDSQIKEMSKDLDSLQKNIEHTKEQKIEIEQWLEKNYVLDELKKDIILISQLISTYKENKDSTEKDLKNSSFKNEFANNEWKNYSDISEKLIHQTIEKLKENTQFFDEKYSAIDLSEVLDRKINEIQIAEKTFDLSSRIVELNNKIITNSEIEKQKNKQKNNLIDILQKSENEKEIVSKKIEEIQKRIEREQLEAKYEQDRLNLKQQEACPLCGSVDHPFVKSHFENKLDSTKELLKQNEKNKTDLDKNIQKLSNEKSSIEAHLENLQKSLNEDNLQNEKYKKEFTELNNSLIKKFDYFQMDKIKEFKEKLLTEKKELQEQINFKNKIQILKQQKQELEYLNEKINNTLNSRSKYSQKLINYKEYFVGASKNEQILEMLRNNLKQFEQNTEQKLKCENEISSNNKLLEQLKTQIAQINIQKNEIFDELKGMGKDFETQKFQLKNIETEYFDSLNFMEFEKYLTEKISNVKEKLADLRTKFSALQAQISEKRIIFSELKKSIDEKNKEFESKNEILRLKLEELNIASIEEALQNILTEEKFKQIKAQEKYLKDRQNVLSENIEQFETEIKKLLEKDNSEKTCSQIEAELKSLEETLEDLNVQIGEIGNKLENDNQQRRKLQSLVDEINKLQNESERWQKLNNLIGDSTGKKFSEIAQQFTLSQLILLANNHLEKFSNRYQLDKTGEAKNNLFVYDKYQGFSVRSVQTLSGGETFLVSLSLALALSDLASQKTKIESLFIDEGFGSLDEDMLDNALVNLEKLHVDSARTIGLISHVADIKERINTKIILEKDNSGFSKIRYEF